MLTQIFWWLGMALEAALLLRATRRNLIKVYPIFYSYLAYVFIESLLRFYVYVRHPTVFGSFYWSTQLVSVILGYGVVWEICRQALSRYPGALRMARSIVLLIFVVVTLKVLVNSLDGEVRSLAGTTAELERSFRVVQAFLISAIVGVLVHYRIRIGRNLLGLISGYGFFIAASIVNLTVRAFLGEGVQWLWQYLPAGAYLVALFTWCATMWSYQPNPEPKAEPRLEHDYQALVHSTRQRFRQVRAHVGRAARP
ncbi:MAG: hypothetical protein L0387_39570 [Acidobacteria bacterium]|nr:hypothetical protein [Acidobacteriota bacterium]MCI0722908.1 hypothetical protein [Acidobacteriota bacterium]